MIPSLTSGHSTLQGWVPEGCPRIFLRAEPDDLIICYPNLNKAICCNLDVSMARSLSYYLHSKTNRNNVFWRRGVFLTSVLKRNVLLAGLVKLAHNVLKSALTSGDKTNLFPWNISHTTLVCTQKRKLSANIKMFLKQTKQKTASIKHFRYSVANPHDYGVIVSAVGS